MPITSSHNNISTNILHGLSDEEVKRSRAENGLNILTPPKKTPLWKLYLEKYGDPMIQILLVAAVISLVLALVKGEYLETIGIFVAIFIATTVGFYFECDASKKFDILNAVGEEQPVKVRRNGKVVEVARKDVVVGDIVVLEVGDEIPADGLLLKGISLQVDESSLTGESLTSKYAETNETTDSTYPVNMLLRSTMVMNGRGEMVVKAVGDKTEIGHVARKSAEDTNVKTPLNSQLERLGKMISWFGFSLSAFAGVAFFIHDALVNNYSGWMDWTELVLKYFMMAVTLIVMAVPEGLPMAITLALALNMRRMLKSNNLVRKLHACETMGVVNVICTDKTGTLTQNKMKVACAETFEADDTETLYEAIAVNSTANIDADGNSVGNPTEAALLLWLQDKGIDYEPIRANSQIINQIPFSTEAKQMVTTIVGSDSREHIYIKGAPEIVISECGISKEKKAEVEKILVGYQQRGMRTLALARKLGEDTVFTLQAIFGITDPVREDVPLAVKECQKAGIEVKIVTGDVSITAMEIARQIGLHGESISGEEFSQLSDDEAAERIKSICVMSRARPADKQRLVQLLQREGNIVAVTGDGTNDAPALNYAHVGLSLGSGTSVAKQASDMTLTDDSFGSIAHAVMWGRSLFRNIQRFLFFQLAVNVSALLLVIAGSFLGTEMPLTVTQILWVNLIMDTFAAMALASLPPSKDVMNEKPRQQSEFIISNRMFKQIGFCGIFFATVMFAMLVYCERNGNVDIHELTIFFTTFVMLQFWNLFNAKSLGTNRSALKDIISNRKGHRGFLFVLFMVLIGQIAIVEFGGEMFRTVSLSIVEWIVIIASTSLVMWIPELWRILRNKTENSND